MLELHTPEGLNVFGNLIESNSDSPNYKYYGSLWRFARHLLGYSWQPLNQNKLVPSALEHYSTSMRDPVFFQLYKLLALKFQRFMSHFTPYSEKELVLPGVKVTEVKMDSLITYFDSFYTDLSNAVWYNLEEKYDFHVRAHQYRLNHKPFSVKINIDSDKEQKVTVKLFVAPKHDEYGRELNLTENRMNMFELDLIVWQLKSGKNEIVRNSNDFVWYVDDRVSHEKLYQSVVDAIEHNQPFYINPTQNYIGYPRR